MTLSGLRLLGNGVVVCFLFVVRSKRGSYRLKASNAAPPNSTFAGAIPGLRDMGHKIGRTVVGELLYKLDYRLQANRKTREGASHPDRDAQFRYINDRVKAALAAGEPASGSAAQNTLGEV